MDDPSDKYAHIRAYLLTLEREHTNKSPTDGADLANDGGSLASRIAGLLVDDDEDEVKSILVSRLGIPESSVSPPTPQFIAFSACSRIYFTFSLTSMTMCSSSCTSTSTISKVHL
jgi:hypothetical protein